MRLDRPPPIKELRCDDDGLLFSLKLSWSVVDRVEERKRLIVPRVRISSVEKESDFDFLAFLLGLGGRLKGLRMSTVNDRDCGLGE